MTDTTATAPATAPAAAPDTSGATEPQFQPVPKPSDFDVPEEVPAPADTPVPPEVVDVEQEDTDAALGGLLDRLPEKEQAIVKSGYKTTEFGLTLAVAVLTAVGAIPMPEHYRAYVIGGLTGVYAVSRGVAKAAALLGLGKATAPQGPGA